MSIRPPPAMDYSLFFFVLIFIFFLFHSKNHDGTKVWRNGLFRRFLPDRPNGVPGKGARTEKDVNPSVTRKRLRTVYRKFIVMLL
jgi:hypothetical protein